MKKGLLVVFFIMSGLFISITAYADWKEHGVVDDFGDAIDASVLVDTVHGTFSNSATENADLTVDIKYQFNTAESGGNYTGFSFKLLEYNDNPANFIDSAEFLYKIDGEVNDSTLYETTSAGVVCDGGGLGCKAPMSASCEIAKALSEGKEVKCVIKHMTSKYNFTLKPDGFAKIYQPAMYDYIISLADSDGTKSQSDYQNYARAMETVGDYEDAKELVEKYEQASEDQEFIGDYNDAVALMDEGKYKEAIELFSQIENFRDSKEKIEIARNTIRNSYSGTWEYVSVFQDEERKVDGGIVEATNQFMAGSSIVIDGDCIIINTNGKPRKGILEFKFDGMEWPEGYVCETYNIKEEDGVDEDLYLADNGIAFLKILTSGSITKPQYGDVLSSDDNDYDLVLQYEKKDFNTDAFNEIQTTEDQKPEDQNIDEPVDDIAGIEGRYQSIFNDKHPSYYVFFSDDNDKTKGFFRKSGTGIYEGEYHIDGETLFLNYDKTFMGSDEYTIIGDYLISEKWDYDGTIPDTDVFDATVSYSDTIYTFMKDGTFKEQYELSEYSDDYDPNGNNTKIVNGTYERRDDLISMTFETGNTVNALVHNGTYNDSAYKKVGGFSTEFNNAYKEWLQEKELGLVGTAPVAPVSTGKTSSAGKVYSGIGIGLGGEVTVSLTIDGETITAVEIDASGETPEIGGAAVEELSKQIIDAQSADIDGVSGATLTSEAVIEATTMALAEARENE